MSAQLVTAVAGTDVADVGRLRAALLIAAGLATADQAPTAGIYAAAAAALDYPDDDVDPKLVAAVIESTRERRQSTVAVFIELLVMGDLGIVLAAELKAAIEIASADIATLGNVQTPADLGWDS